MNQKIRSLNVYLTEVENQYSDCFGEASKQDILLELQRETIAKLKNQIKFLKCDAFLNAFMLHFIYYFVLYKYKEEVKIQNSKVHDLELKMKDLVCMNNNYEERYGKLDFKYQESNKKVEILRSSFEESRQTSAKMQCEIERLTLENTDLKKRLQVYKLDFNLIEEEMKKMGIIDPSMESLKIEVEGLRSENDKFKFNAECYEKTLKDLKFSNKCLSKKLSDIKYSRDTSLEKYNERIAGHQIEINIRNAKIKNLNNQIKYNKKEIIDQSQTIEDLKNKLCENEHRITNYSADLNSAKERIKNLQSHINKLQRILDEKSYRMEKLEDDNKILKNNSEFEKTELRMANEKSKNEKCLLELKFEKAERKLIDLQKNYDKALHDLNKKNQCLCSLGIKRCALLKYEANNPEKINHDEENEIHLKNIKSEEVIEKLRKDLEDTREKLAAKNDEFAAVQTKLNAVSSKYDSAERNCQRQKDELMLLEKKLTCINQKFQNCTDKNVELIRQNKLLEENYNKCITELEDIMLQLEDMQSSLVELRNECDAKTKSLDDVSTELDKMRVSRSEVCEESQYVLQWVRLWMHKQKQTNFILQNKLDEKHRQLLVVNAEKRNNMITTKRLKRKNKILAKRLKIIRKPILKPACIITNGYPEISEPIEKFITLRQGNLNSFNSYKNKSNAIYCLFRRERKKKSDPIDIVTTHGDCKWFRNLGYLSKQLPKSSQIRGSNRPERKISEETTDYGYQTSSSK